MKKDVQKRSAESKDIFEDDFFDSDDDYFEEKTEISTEPYTSSTTPTKVLPAKNESSNSNFEDDDFFENIDHIKSSIDKKIRPFNPSVDVDPSIYCGIYRKFPLGCLQQSFVELWNYDKDVIMKLSREEIIKALNDTKINPMTGHDLDLLPLLGGVEYDENGAIISAKAIRSNFMLYVNFSDTDSEKVGNIAGTEDWVSEEGAYWEYEFLQRMENFKKLFVGTNASLYFGAGRSYADLSAEAMFKDTDKLSVGIIFMFVYMQLVISKFSWTEIRMSLGSLGLLSVGMGFISGCGICSALGISYGPVHTSLPFLLMGLGVDDMFVMMACYRKIQTDPVSTI
jgi:hypothetical protein